MKYAMYFCFWAENPVLCLLKAQNRRVMRVRFAFTQYSIILKPRVNDIIRHKPNTLMGLWEKKKRNQPLCATGIFDNDPSSSSSSSSSSSNSVVNLRLPPSFSQDSSVDNIFGGIL